jgi:hypothetical protein
MRTTPFTRPTVVAAVELLDQHTQASFDQMVIRLGLEGEISSGTALSVKKKCALLSRIVVQRPTEVVATVDGNVTLAEATVREAVQLTKQDSRLAFSNTQMIASQTAFMRGLARDGYVVSWDEDNHNPKLRVALPNEIELPETDDEVRQLLKHFQFFTPLGHLEQAIEAHTRGDWAAANSQLRSFIEGLFDDIASQVRPSEAAQLSTSENRRKLLADEGFLAVDRNEWTQDGKNYINGLFKMLHTDGSHPGLSDEDHSTFRLHIVLVTARTFLRRLRYNCNRSNRTTARNPE